MQAIAPNIGGRYYLLRPTAAFSDPPLCSLADLCTVLTLDHLADMHEALNLREAMLERIEQDAERNRDHQRRGIRR